MFQNIASARAYLNERNTSVFGLDAITNLLSILGNPERNTRFIHITGTNGKGSTSAYLINILIASGYNVGSFSSPQVFNLNEIIMYNYEPISDAEFLSLASEVHDAISVMESKGMRLPTCFEMETAMAFLFFKRKNVDVAVVEVGMGGELDSTNVIENTLMEIITHISYDHVGVLGNTLEEIATNKTGIIKNNSIVVTTSQYPQVMDVIISKCNNMNAELVKVDDGIAITSDASEQVIAYRGREYVTKMLGYYQIYNTPLAIEGARCLKNKGFERISEATISKGIEQTCLSGRFEIIGKSPVFVIDGAHNDAASVMLAHSIKNYFGDKKITYLIGIFKDKDYKKIVENTIGLADEVITFDWDNPRHLSGEELRKIISGYMNNVHYAGSVENAVKMAIDGKGKDDVIVAFGSLSHLAEIKNAYKGVVKNGRY